MLSPEIFFYCLYLYIMPPPSRKTKTKTPKARERAWSLHTRRQQDQRQRAHWTARRRPIVKALSAWTERAWPPSLAEVKHFELLVREAHYHAMQPTVDLFNALLSRLHGGGVAIRPADYRQVTDADAVEKKASEAVAAWNAAARMIPGNIDYWSRRIPPVQAITRNVQIWVLARLLAAINLEMLLRPVNRMWYTDKKEELMAIWQGIPPQDAEMQGGAAPTRRGRGERMRRRRRRRV